MEIINFDSVSITVPVFYLLHIKEVPVEDEQRDTTFPIWKNISTSNIIIPRIDKVSTLAILWEKRKQQARKPRSYASPKLRNYDWLTDLLTGVKCRATSVAKNNYLCDSTFQPYNLPTFSKCRELGETRVRSLNTESVQKQKKQQHPLWLNNSCRATNDVQIQPVCPGFLTATKDLSMSIYLHYLGEL